MFQGHSGPKEMTASTSCQQQPPFIKVLCCIMVPNIYKYTSKEHCSGDSVGRMYWTKRGEEDDKRNIWKYTDALPAVSEQ